MAVLLLIVFVLPARSQEAPSEPSGEAVESTDQDEAPPVGGVFGLFRGARKAPTPPAEAPPVVEAPSEPKAVPAAEATPKAEAAPSPIPTAAPAPAFVPPAPEPTEVSPEVPEEGKAGAPPSPTAEEESKAPEMPAPRKETGKASLPEPVAPAPGGKPRGGKSDVELPTAEIQGELEKPDIFFLVPRARDQSDEQMIRARIRREINRPVIKDWVEEEMLLK
jgi:hypothetical protein